MDQVHYVLQHLDDLNSVLNLQSARCELGTAQAQLQQVEGGNRKMARMVELQGCPGSICMGIIVELIQLRQRLWVRQIQLTGVGDAVHLVKAGLPHMHTVLPPRARLA